MDRRDVCFTIHYAPTPQDVMERIIVAGLYKITGKASYCIVGLEKGKSGLTLHLQGFVQFTRPFQATQAKRLLGLYFEGGKVPHVEFRRALPSEAAMYCTKESVFVKEIGQLDNTRPTKDANITLSEFFEKLKQGEDFNELSYRYPWISAIHGKKIEEWMDRHDKFERKTKPYVTYVYGPTGTGKTRLAMAHDKKPYTWPYDEKLHSYQGQKTILFDDFRGEVSYSTMLRLMDRHPNSLSIKGAFQRQNKADHIFITSDRHFREFWPNERDTEKSQFSRRVDRVLELKDEVASVGGGGGLSTVLP